MEYAEVTVHGFRSSFRDWAAEATEYPSDLVEMALAHTISSKVEAAYRRGDMIEKRLALMEDWAKHCNTAKT
jgi:integrase